MMSVELQPENMIVRVLDQGNGFELTEIPDPLAEENLLRTSGRGLFLMRAFMDEFKVESRARGWRRTDHDQETSPTVSGNGKHQPE